MIDNSKYAIQHVLSKALPKRIFLGTYKRAGAKLTHTTEPDTRLIIGTRLKTTKYKPKHFLLLFEGRNQPNIYFSSLYPTTDPTRFEIEHDGVRYELFLSADKADILLLNQSQQVA